MKELNVKELNENVKEYKENKTYTVLRHALAEEALQEVVKSHDNQEKVNFNFEIDIKTMPVTNQKQSGRCWIFSALNVLREICAKKLNVDELEFSESYIAYYDKLEKVNFELETIISLMDSDDDRTLNHVLNNTIGDGGQWDMFVSLVTKYGVVPKQCFEETFQSSQTQHLNFLLSIELKKFASRVKRLFNEGGIEKVREDKEALLKRIQNFLMSCYGVPVQEFTFEYRDKDNKFNSITSTPLEFFNKYLKDEVVSFVSLINAPTKDKEYNKSYTIEYLGNVVGGRQVKHLNLSMERLKELIISQLKDGQIVWFGSDVSFYRCRNKYYWDDNQFDYETPFDLSFKATKEDALDFNMSAMNHAMCITGVSFDREGKPNRWKIENSWGSDVGQKGYYLMSDTYFDNYVYQAAVYKKYLTKEELDAYNAEPIVLKPWDPFGTLA